MCGSQSEKALEAFKGVRGWGAERELPVGTEGGRTKAAPLSSPHRNQPGSSLGQPLVRTCKR